MLNHDQSNKLMAYLRAHEGDLRDVIINVSVHPELDKEGNALRSIVMVRKSGAMLLRIRFADYEPAAHHLVLTDDEYQTALSSFI